MEDSEGNTPLIIAAKNGKVDVVRLLMNRKADITSRNLQNATCLDVAVENGRTLVAMEIVKSEK
jgi:ankyrin repeat protein